MPYTDKEKAKQYWSEYAKQHRKQKNANGHKSYYKNHEHTLKLKRKSWAKRTSKIATQRAERRRELKLQVIAHYGGFCACCNETAIEFLCVDHINGDGAKHRKQIGNSRMYEWIIKNNFPTNFRILCANCNHSFGAYGYCPHGGGLDAK